MKLSKRQGLFIGFALLMGLLLFFLLRLRSPQQTPNPPDNPVLLVQDRGEIKRGDTWEYNGRPVIYPAADRFFDFQLTPLQLDLPRLKHLLQATSLRFQISSSESRWAALQATQKLCQESGFRLEFTLVQTPEEKPEQLINWLKKLKSLGWNRSEILGLHFKPSAKETPQTAQLWLKSAMQTVHELWGIEERPFIGLVIEKPVEAPHPNLNPDLYLLSGSLKPNQLNASLKRLKERLKDSLIQLQIPSMPADSIEYDQAWHYRYGFYFSKAHDLAYPAIHAYDHHTQVGTLYPGILRDDHSERTSFLLSQIYFQVHTLDINEKVLENVLQSASDLKTSSITPQKPKDWIRFFFETYYNDRTPSKIIALFSESLKRFPDSYIRYRTEESILNSHFAHLEKLQILSLNIRNPQQQIAQVKLEFMTSLGPAVFLQTIDFQSEQGEWRLKELLPPQGLPENHSGQLNPDNTLSLRQKITPALKLKTQWLPSLGTSDQGLLHYQVQNISSQRLDIQALRLNQNPLSIQVPPLPLFLSLRYLAPGESAEGYIPEVKKPIAESWIEAAYNPSSLVEAHEPPLHLKVSYRQQNAKTLNLEVWNPHVERALFPVITYTLETHLTQENGYFLLERALLPLEKRSVSLPWPHAQPPQHLFLAGHFQAMTDPVLNMDEAFRYASLGQPEAAREKYFRLWERFKHTLNPQQREQVLWARFELELQTQTPQQAEPLAHLLLQEQTPKLRQAERLYKISEAFLNAGQIKKALQMISEYEKDLPFHLKLSLLKAHLLESNGHYQEALYLLKSIWQKQPSLEVNRKLFYLERDHGSAYEALKWLSHLQKQNPKDVLLWKEKGFLHKRLKQLKEAIAAYRIYLNNLSDFQIERELGYLLLANGQYKEALQVFQKVLQVCPETCPNELASSADLLKRLGRPQEALMLYLRHARLTGNSNSWYIAGELALSTHQYEQAYQALLQVKSRTGHDAKLTRTLAYLARQTGRMITAENLYKTYLAQAPQDKNARRELAFLSLNLGHFQQASQHFETLYQAGDHSPSIQQALAYAYLNSGRATQARNLYANLRKSAPQNKAHLRNYLSALQRLNLLPPTEKADLEKQSLQDPPALQSLIELGIQVQAYEWSLNLAYTGLKKGQGNALFLHRAAAHCLEKTGDAPGAIRELEKARRLIEPALHPDIQRNSPARISH